MRFLVLNSDAERRDGLKALLRQIDRHARINDAPDGFQARRLLRTQRFDLVAIDWLDVGRHSELQALCSACSPTPAAVLIDESTPEAIQRFYNYGVAGVIPHSTRPHLIVRALEMVLLGGAITSRRSRSACCLPPPRRVTMPISRRSPDRCRAARQAASCRLDRRRSCASSIWAAPTR